MVGFVINKNRTINRSFKKVSFNLDAISEDGEPDGPNPDNIKAMLEDALVILGNANAQLNGWRQRRFSEFLTEIGMRTLREGIPTDSHLFPHKFHT